MTAEIIRIDHELPEFMFHCPLTGTPIVGDIDQSFERFASPYFLFSITEAGIVHSRRDELPESIGVALKRVIDNLFDVGHPGPQGISSFELHTCMPNVIAVMLPDSTMIFDIGGKSQLDQSSPRTWVAMDFTLPIRMVDEECIDHSADLVPVV